MTSSDFYTGLTEVSANTFQWPNQINMNWSDTAPWAGQPAGGPGSCAVALQANNYSWSTVPCTQTMASLFCELGTPSKPIFISSRNERKH